MLFSGLLCFVLERNWFIKMHYIYKIPLYSILGVAVWSVLTQNHLSSCPFVVYDVVSFDSFALLFSIIDLINYCCGLCQNETSKPLVETEIQVYLVVTTAVIMGFVFGLVFGLLDVEDAKLSSLRVELLREER